MRYLNPLRYIHYHTQLAIPTIYDDSLSFYEIMNKTNLHFNEVINDMNENYEIIDKAFQEVLEQTNKWMEEAKAQADRAEQEANKSQASAEDAKKQADRASSEADRAKSEADAAAASAVEAQKQADRASSEADRAHTEAENAKAQAQAAANSAQESAGSASESAKSAEASKNSAVASANSASQAAQSATASQNSAEASANSASQAAQSATDAANSAKEAADTLDAAKETFVKKAGDTMTGNLTMGLNQIVMDTGHIVAGNNTLLFEGYPLIDVDGAKISMVANPAEAMDAANKEYVDNAVAGVKPTGDYLPLTGGTMSGDINMGVNNSVRFGAANYALYQNEGTGHLVLTGNSNTDIVEMNNIGTVQFGNETTIRNIKTPTNNQDAVPKSYVDGQISIAKNDVYEQIHNYLPLTGGTLTGAVRFGTTASIGELVDFGLVAKMDSGNLGIVTQSIIHTNDSTSTDGVTYTLANVDSDIHYTCAGNGVRQMNIGSFETVKVSSSLLVAEDPTQNMQVATKQYVDQHAGGGGEYVPLNNNLICYISEIGGGVYKCDCYLLEQFNMKGTIYANEDSFKKSINHNLNDYLETNNYSVIGGSLDTFIFMGVGGGHTIITCTGHLYSTSLTLKIITTTFESEDKTIDQNINAGKVGSMLLRKNR